MRRQNVSQGLKSPFVFKGLGGGLKASSSTGPSFQSFPRGGIFRGEGPRIHPEVCGMLSNKR